MFSFYNTAANSKLRNRSNKGDTAIVPKVTCGNEKHYSARHIMLRLWVRNDLIKYSLNSNACHRLTYKTTKEISISFERLIVALFHQQLE